PATALPLTMDPPWGPPTAGLIPGEPPCPLLRPFPPVPGQVGQEKLLDQAPPAHMGELTVDIVDDLAATGEGGAHGAVHDVEQAVGFLIDPGGIGLPEKQLLQILPEIDGIDLEQPACSIGIAIDQAGILPHLGIDGL